MIVTLNFNISKLACFCGRKSTNAQQREEDLEALIRTINNLIALKQGDVITFELIMAKLLNFVNADTGFIHRVQKNDNEKLIYEPLVFHGISTNDYVFFKTFTNIPLFYHDSFIGAVGLGGKDTDIERFNMLSPVFDIIAKQLYILNQNDH